MPSYGVASGAGATLPQRLQESTDTRKEGDSPTRMIKTFFDWLIDVAALPLCVGVVLALLDFLRAYQRWGGSGRWLTFDNDFHWRFALLYIVALLVERATSLVFLSGTRTGYLVALAVALLQAAIFVLGVFLIDSILRTPSGIHRALSIRSHPRVSVEPARDTTGAAFDPIDCEVDTLFKATLQADLGPKGAGHNRNERGRRLNVQRDQ